MARKNKAYNETSGIGDYKSPNKYYVSGSNDFYINKNGMNDWASETENFEAKLTLPTKRFNTYKEAKEYVDDNNSNIYEGSIPKVNTINTIVIEDRISGQIYEESLTATKIKEGIMPSTKIYSDTREDTKFSKDELKKRGEEFK